MENGEFINEYNYYLKLDITLIKNIHKDMIKYAMVKSLVEFANLTNIELIAEGVECEEELKALLKLGVHNAQGYFLRKVILKDLKHCMHIDGYFKPLHLSCLKPSPIISPASLTIINALLSYLSAIS